jgi:hypothetical protein
MVVQAKAFRYPFPGLPHFTAPYYYYCFRYL